MLEYFEDVMNSSSTRNGKKVSKSVRLCPEINFDENKWIQYSKRPPFCNEEKERSDICCEGQFNII